MAAPPAPPGLASPGNWPSSSYSESLGDRSSECASSSSGMRLCAACGGGCDELRGMPNLRSELICEAARYSARRELRNASREPKRACSRSTLQPRSWTNATIVQSMAGCKLHIGTSVDMGTVASTAGAGFHQLSHHAKRHRQRRTVQGGRRSRQGSKHSRRQHRDGDGSVHASARTAVSSFDA